MPSCTQICNDILKNNPKEVKDTLFINLAKRTLGTTGQFNNYDQYCYNKNGDLVFHKNYMSDSEWSVTNMQYNSNGEQSKTLYSGSDNRPWGNSLDSEKISSTFENGKFIVKNFSLTGFEGKPDVTYVAFFDKGNTMQTERLTYKEIEYNDKNGMVRSAGVSDSLIIADTEYTYYDKEERISRWEARQGGVLYQYRNFFYTRNSSPDSIQYVYNGRNIYTWVYTYNENGNPVKFLEIADRKDTVKNFWMQYEYDKKGNWIKMVEKEVHREKRQKKQKKDGQTFWIPFDSVSTRYFLHAREIKY